MTEKLPVKTFMLRPQKKYGPIAGAIVFLAIAFFLFQFGMGLERVAGRFLSFVLFSFTLVIAFFCIIGFIHLKKEKFIGFFISNEGFNDISTGHQYGIVQWKDIIKIRIVEDLDHPGRKYICLKLKNPQEYIDREPVQYKKRSLELKYHYYGSPVCFSNRGLNCTFNELEETVRKYYDHYLNHEKEKAEKEENKEK